MDEHFWTVLFEVGNGPVMARTFKLVPIGTRPIPPSWLLHLLLAQEFDHEQVNVLEHVHVCSHDAE